MSGSPKHLRALADELALVAAQPTQPEHIQRVGELRETLSSALTDTPSDEFSPAWRQTLDELGIAHLLGEYLRDTVEGILQRNDITPTIASDELKPLADELQALQDELARLTGALAHLRIGQEELNAGEFEVGFLIPRAAVSNEMQNLGRELVELETRILDPFLELGIGQRPDVEIRSISSSAFQIFLSSPGATALLLAKALQAIVDTLEKLISIKKNYDEMKRAGIAEERLTGIADHADELMGKTIKQTADELVEESGVHLNDEGRRNELRKELARALTEIARRLDQGYNIDVRRGELPPPPPEPEEGEQPAPDPIDVDTRRYAEGIAQRHRALRFMNQTGAPILRLEPAEQGEQGEPDSSD